MATKSTHIAVLTGDIIGSTQMAPADLERAFDALSACAETQAEWHGESLHFTRQRGDGWQVRLARPELALRSALAFRAALRSEGKEFSTRMAVAEGPAMPHPSGADLNSVTDKVYIESGQALDEIKTRHIPIQLVHQKLNKTGAAFALADHISQGWTQAQAAAMLPMLAPGETESRTALARSLGKSRQAVTKALDAAAFEAIWYALHNLEAEEPRT